MNGIDPRGDWCAQLVCAWVAIYTAGLPTSVAAERREEVEADLWDEAINARVGGRTDALPGQRLSRLVRGLPSDIAWRLESRSRNSRSWRETMRPTPIQWLLLGVSMLLFAVTLIAAGIAVLNPDPERWQGWGPYGATIAGAIGLGGIVALARWPTAGLVLVLAAATLAALAMPWLWPVAVIPAAASIWPWLASRPSVQSGQA